MRIVKSTIDEAQAVGYATTLCSTLSTAACPIALLVSDLALAQHYIDMLLYHAASHGRGTWHAWGRGFEGALAIKRGDVRAGQQLLRSALGELSEAGLHTHYVGLTAELASALGRAGEAAQALATIDAALDWSERTEEGWCVAELLRIKGELLLLQDEAEAEGAAENHFQQALDWAHRQGALSWKLRAATSLARLLCNHDRATEAITLLAPIYGSFTEGFTTSDLLEAKNLLEHMA